MNCHGRRSTKSSEAQSLPFTTVTLLVAILHAQSTTAQGPEVSPDGDVSIWYPTVQGNGSLLSFNAIDTLVMSYETEWQAINASMWCLTNDTSTNAYTGQDMDSPRPPIGNYIIHDLNNQIDATNFPLPCHFAFVDTGNASDTYAGGTFMMTSTIGPAMTWSLNAQSVAIVGTTPSTLSSSASTLSSVSKTPTSSPVVSFASNASHQSDNAPDSSSKPPLGMIIAPAIILTIVVVGLLLIWWWVHRRSRQAPSVRSSQMLVACEHDEPHWKQHCELGVEGAKYEMEPSPSIVPIVTWRGMHEMEAPDSSEGSQGKGGREDR